jgi:hypothetical protein
MAALARATVVDAPVRVGVLLVIESSHKTLDLSSKSYGSAITVGSRSLDAPI